MKQTWILFWVAAGLFCFKTAWAVDMRAVSRQAQADYEAAQAEAKARQVQILQDRTALQTAVMAAQAQVQELQAQAQGMQAELDRLAAKEKELAARQSEDQTDMTGYAGVVRQAARDLAAILSRSQFTARNPGRGDLLTPITDSERFPGIDEMNTLAGLFFEEMARTGEVERFEGSFIGRSGDQQTGVLLTVGPFCAAYVAGQEAGFLRYAEAGRQFGALAALPSWYMRRNIKAYLAGRSEALYIDPSAGTALQRIAHRSTWSDQLRQGGILVWPILALGLAALLLTGERLVFLHKVHTNADRLMGRVNDLAARGDWGQCHEIISGQRDRPVCNVLKSGLGAVNESREILENVLQEAILKELPRLERFLPALNVIAAVAPLLGLLGTVTGMIGTFHVITLYGTGDPRLMAGGISEALVTTMLGLALAIPVMLIHAFLRRRIEHIVGDMEEKALAMSNIICRECNLAELPNSRQAGIIAPKAPAGKRVAAEQ
jgi:biopolymer transport protein ExbB